MADINLKKKVGPLPIWGWIVLGGGGLGLLYYLHEKDSSSTTSSADTDAALAAEQQSANTPYPYYDSGSGGAASPTTVPPSDTTTVSDLEGQLNDIQGELDTLSQGGLQDQEQNAYPSLTQEGQDLLAAKSTLQSLGLVANGSQTTSTGSSPKGATATALAKLVPGLTILQQLEDVQAGKLPKTDLGTNAKAALAAANGNVAQAIKNREALTETSSKKPVTHTPSIAKRKT